MCLLDKCVIVDGYVDRRRLSGIRTSEWDVDGNISVGRPSLLFFQEKVCFDYNFLDTFLGEIDAGDEGFSLFKEFAA